MKVKILSILGPLLLMVTFVHASAVQALGDIWEPGDTVFAPLIKPAVTWLYEQYVASPPSASPGVITQQSCIRTCVGDRHRACVENQELRAREICLAAFQSLWPDGWQVEFFDTATSFLQACLSIEVSNLVGVNCTPKCDVCVKACLGDPPTAAYSTPACGDPDASTRDFTFSIEHILAQTPSESIAQCVEAKRLCSAYCSYNATWHAEESYNPQLCKRSHDERQCKYALWRPVFDECEKDCRASCADCANLASTGIGINSNPACDVLGDVFCPYCI